MRVAPILSTNAQVVIPKDVRDKLDIQSGDRVVIDVIGTLEEVPDDPVESGEG